LNVEMVMSRYTRVQSRSASSVHRAGYIKQLIGQVALTMTRRH